MFNFLGSVHELAKLMLNPEKNFDELYNIWETELKFRIMTGGLN